MLLDQFKWMVVAYDDWFIPEVAQLVLDAIADLDDEDAAVTITCYAYNCEGDQMRN